MYFSIDRISGDVAVLLDEAAKPLEIPVSMLPEEAKEGEMVLYKGGVFFAAPDKTAERRAQMAKVLEQLLKKDES